MDAPGLCSHPAADHSAAITRCLEKGVHPSSGSLPAADAPAPDAPASDFSPPSGFLSFLLSNENENDDIPAPKGARGGG